MPLDLSRYLGLYMDDAREKLQLIKLQLIVMPYEMLRDASVYWSMVEKLRALFHALKGSSLTIGMGFEEDVAPLALQIEVLLKQKLAEREKNLVLTMEEIEMLRIVHDTLLQKVEYHGKHGDTPSSDRAVGERPLSDLEVLSKIWFNRICVNQRLREKFRGRRYAVIQPGIVEPLGPYDGMDEAKAAGNLDIPKYVLNCLHIPAGTSVLAGAEVYRSQWESWETEKY